MSDNKDFLIGMAIGGAAVGVPLGILGICAHNRIKQDNRLTRAVIDEIVNNPEKMLQGLELAKGLKNMDEFRVKAREFLNED